MRATGSFPAAAARFRSPGRLAQLGERQLDKLEVTGSSPVTPIEFRATEPKTGLWFEPTSSPSATATCLRRGVSPGSAAEACKCPEEALQTNASQPRRGRGCDLSFPMLRLGTGGLAAGPVGFRVVVQRQPGLERLRSRAVDANRSR